MNCQKSTINLAFTEIKVNSKTYCHHLRCDRNELIWQANEITRPPNLLSERTIGRV